ncbi:ECF transporter S component [bacterium]|nr:ECF transporter S component [bacterium]
MPSLDSQLARRVSRAAMLAAAAVAFGYLFFAIPNVELVTATVAVAGLLLGPGFGFAVGVVAYAVFGALNPLGSSMAIPSMWVAQMLGQGINGLLFGLVRHPLNRSTGQLRIALFALMGLFVTLLYQVILSLSFYLFAPMAETTLIGFLIGGILFSLTQIAINTLIFALVVPLAVSRLRKLPGFAE